MTDHKRHILGIAISGFYTNLFSVTVVVGRSPKVCFALL